MTNTGELSCRFHLARTLEVMSKAEEVVVSVKQIQRKATRVVHYCVCNMAAEFYVVKIALDQDDPFPIFRTLN